MLEDTIAFALSAHRGQCDKTGSPYILHVLRVMDNAVKTARRYGKLYRLSLKPEDFRILRLSALLHDIVEDTDITFEDLRKKGYPDIVVETVSLLTKRKGEGWHENAIRIIEGRNLYAAIIKSADAQDNADQERYTDQGLPVTEKVRVNTARYATIVNMMNACIAVTAQSNYQ